MLYTSDPGQHHDPPRRGLLNNSACLSLGASGGTEPQHLPPQNTTSGTHAPLYYKSLTFYLLKEPINATFIV
jgi:hypothetical protein